MRCPCSLSTEQRHGLHAEYGAVDARRGGHAAGFGPSDRPPFPAVPINPGDPGTRVGLNADALGRVHDANGAVTPGLYAAGNPLDNR